ncbi:hypothetical protein ABPG74_003051 [Tetrahymena malaccensis]
MSGRGNQNAKSNVSLKQPGKIAERLELLKQSVKIKKQKSDDLREIVKIKMMEKNEPKKCAHCEAVVIDIRQHMRRKHPGQFLENGDNKNKYKVCQICRIALKNENFEEHQMQCEIKQTQKQDLKSFNKLRKLESFGSSTFDLSSYFQKHFEEYDAAEEEEKNDIEDVGKLIQEMEQNEKPNMKNASQNQGTNLTNILGNLSLSASENDAKQKNNFKKGGDTSEENSQIETEEEK